MARTRSRSRSDDEFEELPEEASDEALGELIEFDPTTPSSNRGAEPEVAEAPESADTIPLRDEWLSAQEDLERQLNGNTQLLASLGEEVDDYDAAMERVVGTGVGFRVFNGLLTPEVVLKVFVTEKAPEGVASALADLPQTVGALPVDIEAVGDIVPQVYSARYTRPVRCGVSIGHPRVTAGTLGCLVVIGNNRLCLLSNNHVIANSNDASVGDPIIQPGRIDGGNVPGDRIGVLEQFVRINFPGPNLVDAAVAWTSFGNVDPRHVTYTLNPSPTTARLGMTVKKNGRTTQGTVGSITDLSVNISVGFPGGVAQFRNQLGIRGVGGVFSRGGDSGSLIVTANSNQPVGLLFAGRRDNSITFANPIAEVIRSLGIRRFVNKRR